MTQPKAAIKEERSDTGEVFSVFEQQDPEFSTGRRCASPPGKHPARKAIRFPLSLRQRSPLYERRIVEVIQVPDPLCFHDGSGLNSKGNSGSGHRYSLQVLRRQFLVNGKSQYVISEVVGPLPLSGGYDRVSRRPKYTCRDTHWTK